MRAARTLPGVLGPFDSHAVEKALRLREQDAGSEVVAVAVTSSTNVLGGLRDALAMGADAAILVVDPAIDDADLLGRSRVLAALMLREAADICLYCPWSGDIDGTLLWAAAAERMGLPMLSQARSLEVSNAVATTERQTETGDITMSAPLPCLIEVAETINKARRPTMAGRLAAKRKPISLLRLDELGLRADGLRATSIRSLARVTPTRMPIVIDNQQEAADQILAFIKGRGLLS